MEAKEKQKIVWKKQEVAGSPEGSRRKVKHVFLTGMDLFTTEEIAKREKRAERFSTSVGLSYKPVEKDEDEKKKEKRAARFGLEYKEPDLSGMMDMDLFEKRKEAGQGASSRLDTVHVYGVDLLSTKDILKYFSDYLPQYVEWINDSSCNVIFSDDYTAKRVLAGLGKPLAETVDSVDKLFKSMGKTWHKGEDFMKNGMTPVPIMFRLATDEDVKPRGKKVSRGLWLSGNERRRYSRNRKRRSGGEDDVEMRDADDEDRGSRKQRRMGGDLRARISSGNVQDPVDPNRAMVSYDDI